MVLWRSQMERCGDQADTNPQAKRNYEDKAKIRPGIQPSEIAQHIGTDHGEHNQEERTDEDPMNEPGATCRQVFEMI